MRVEGAEVGNRVLKAVDVMEIDLQNVTSVNQINFIPEYRRYIGLGNLGEILICIK